ncbi:hypothetical protein [Xenorhabdus bovienii]|uniref:hypothetical protein n=1 Tax=Xenorhabdus bovienii TaxID=40576 RepID=UPI00237D2585|nr:hypothetical protein [Xenorhabdus bovienii]MDE1475127.1 hypothetical protein [Xenorhabdus bovienii]MDE9429681.1 hypothetical protein [Xenorhabdus bovienii]MDE9459110.1 hypothetical protein [Xenorhabdus bovienii]MDE9487428.1 hypothetical protein [Xenorhabdus bovienii]MDE9516025.1 hypothetical protein [Xenorhabdus bovienii]
MNILNESWEPGFGTIFTWFAMDKQGKIAVMVNNCWGWLPSALLRMNNFEDLLTELNEYKWEESEKYTIYPDNKNGQTILDLYSSLTHQDTNCKDDVEEWVYLAQQSEDLDEINLPARKGLFIYHGIEGSNPGQDTPVGYDGETKMGDYFRYLIPTIYATIEDFPESLRKGIAVSDTLDFTKDRLLDNDKINEYFPRMYS